MSIFPTPQRSLRLLRAVLVVTTLWFLLVSAAAIIGLQLSTSSQDQNGNAVFGHIGTYAAGWVQNAPSNSGIDNGVLVTHGATMTGMSGPHQQLRLTDASIVNTVLSRMDDALPAFLALAISVVFLRIARSVTTNPFIDGNVHRLQWLAGLFALYPIAIFVGNFANQAVFNNYVDTSVLDQEHAMGGIVASMFSQPTSLWAWGVGLGMLVLAHVFAAGVTHREELETFV